MVMNGTEKKAMDGAEQMSDPAPAVITASPNGVVKDGQQVDDLPLDRPNIVVNIGMEMRMSAVGECMRRMSYEAMGLEKTDEIPIENQTLMLIGTYLEPLVKLLMGMDRWTINEEGAVRIRLGWITLAGHPDGVGMHPDRTKGEPVVVEVKTRSDSLAHFCWLVGVERTHPEAVQQAALYSMALFGEVGDVVVATMGRDSGEYRTELIPAERAQIAYNNAIAFVNEVAEMVLSRQIPEPTLPKGDTICQSCPYRTLCGNAEKPEQPGASGLSPEEVVEELNKWIKANADAPKSSSPAAKEKKAAADTIKAHMLAIENLDDEIVVEGQKYSLKVSSSTGVKIDMDAFNELVSPEVREQVVIPTVSHSMRINPVKDKKPVATKATKGKKTAAAKTDAKTAPAKTAAKLAEKTTAAKEVPAKAAPANAPATKATAKPAPQPEKTTEATATATATADVSKASVEATQPQFDV